MFRKVLRHYETVCVVNNLPFIGHVTLLTLVSHEFQYVCLIFSNNFPLTKRGGGQSKIIKIKQNTFPYRFFVSASHMFYCALITHMIRHVQTSRSDRCGARTSHCLLLIIPSICYCLLHNVNFMTAARIEFTEDGSTHVSKRV